MYSIKLGIRLPTHLEKRLSIAVELFFSVDRQREQSG